MRTHLQLLFICSFLLLGCSKKAENGATKKDFKSFLCTNPLPEINCNSYEQGNSDYYFGLFQETGQYDWTKEEWSMYNVYPLWVKYKDKNNLR